MLKNHCLASSIADASWYQFRQWLEHFAAKFGKVAMAVPPQYTSVECSQCKAIVKKSLSTRTHISFVWTDSAKGLERGYQYFAESEI